MRANKNELKKPCSRCGKVKPYSDYYCTKSWFYSYCKDCAKIQRKEYNSRPDVKERIRLSNKARYDNQTGLDRQHEYNKRYESRPEVKAKISARKKAAYQKLKD